MDKKNTVNTAEIMEGIRKKIKEENLSASMLSFDEIDPVEKLVNFEDGYDAALMQSSTEYVSANYQIQPIKPIQGNPFVVLIKKIIRKLNIFFFVPVVNEQNVLNYHFSNAIMQMNGYIHKNMDSESLGMSVKLDDLENRQRNSKREIEELTKQIDELKKEIAVLKKKL